MDDFAPLTGGILQAKIVEAHQNGLRELVTSLSSNIEINTEVLAGIPFLGDYSAALCEMIMTS